MAYFKKARPLLFAGAGALVGFAYYRLIGCSTGACLITASPWTSTLYGGLLGFILSR